MINKIAIIGTGSAGRRYLNIAKARFPNSEIAVFSKTRVGTEILGYRILPTNELLNFSPDIGVIANPSTFHLEIAREIIPVSHILIEKPISNNSIQVHDLILSAKGNQKKISVGYNLRFLNSLKIFDFLIRENLIGEIISFHGEVGSYLPSWREDKNYEESVSSRQELGGGVLLELSHDLNYIEWLFGEIEWIYANSGHISKLKIDVEDYALLIMELNKRQIVGTLNMNFFDRQSTRVLKVIGESGNLIWNGIEGSIYHFDSNRKILNEIYKSVTELPESYFRLWDNFIESIEKDLEPEVSGLEALQTLRVVEAAKKSAELKIRVGI